ncbi:hypothetical protein AAVH_34463, partial [Aphelenchoides avenae]
CIKIMLTEIWKHYDAIEGDIDVVCKVKECRKIIMRNNNVGVNGMWKHLELKHNGIFKKIKPYLDASLSPSSNCVKSNPASGKKYRKRAAQKSVARSTERQAKKAKCEYPFTTKNKIDKSRCKKSCESSAAARGKPRNDNGTDREADANDNPSHEDDDKSVGDVGSISKAPPSPVRLKKPPAEHNPGKERKKSLPSVSRTISKNGADKTRASTLATWPIDVQTFMKQFTEELLKIDNQATRKRAVIMALKLALESVN